MKITDLICARIRALRRQKGWSQDRLAEKAGLSKDAIARIERREREPRLETLALIGEALGLTLPELLDVKEWKMGGEAVSRKKVQRDTAQLRSLSRSLSQLDPWMAKALLSAIRPIVNAQIRSRPRSG